MITAQEIPQPETQSVRVLLKNELGQIVHDMTLPLVTTVETDGKLDHRITDIDQIVAEHVAMHEERHKVFVAAAQKRGLLPEDVRMEEARGPAMEIPRGFAMQTVMDGEKDCRCGPK